MTTETRKIAVGYGGGAMGGLLVGVPAFMTMEICWGGFTIPATRLLVLAAGEGDSEGQLSGGNEASSRDEAPRRSIADERG